MTVYREVLYDRNPFFYFTEFYDILFMKYQEQKVMVFLLAGKSMITSLEKRKRIETMNGIY